jgi:hypothetical protein
VVVVVLTDFEKPGLKLGSPWLKCEDSLKFDIPLKKGSLSNMLLPKLAPNDPKPPPNEPNPPKPPLLLLPYCPRAKKLEKKSSLSNS